jgi:hypothetical protein
MPTLAGSGMSDAAVIEKIVPDSPVIVMFPVAGNGTSPSDVMSIITGPSASMSLIVPSPSAESRVALVGLGLTAPFASQLLAHAGLPQSPAPVAYKPTRAGGGGALRTLFWPRTWKGLEFSTSRWPLGIRTAISSRCSRRDPGHRQHYRILTRAMRQPICQSCGECRRDDQARPETIRTP